MKWILLFGFLASCVASPAQRVINGSVVNTANGEGVAGATVQLSDSSRSVACDANGKFSIETPSAASLVVSATGFATKTITPDSKGHITILLTPFEKEIDAVVVTGTMKAVSKLESPVAVEVYTAQDRK